MFTRPDVGPLEVKLTLLPAHLTAIRKYREKKKSVYFSGILNITC